MTAQPAPSQDTKIETAVGLLARSRRLLVLAGAGMSADAGIPTFRCEGGLWKEFRVEDLAHPDGFVRNPDLVWQWYRERRELVASAQPHAGQRALALLQRHFPGAKVLVATTNEDDLLERAGVEGIVRLHGSLFETTCTAGCGWRSGDDRDNAFSLVPCPRCGARTRPGSVWYGEALPAGAVESLNAFDPDGCLLVGSSGLVQPVASIPADMAHHGMPVVEINPEETPFSSVASISVRGTAKETLPRLTDLLTSQTMQDQRRRLT